MNDSLVFDAGKGCLSARGELTIYQAASAAESLRQAQDTGDLKQVDLAGVTDLDTAGLQLLLMAQALRTAGGEPVSLLNPSEAVNDMFRLAGIDVASGPARTRA